MRNARATAVWVAVLFIIATVASVVAALVLDPLLATADYLAAIDAAPVNLVAAVCLMFVAAAAIIAIPVALFPILRRHSETGALLYFGARIFESVTYLLGGIFTFSLVALAAEAGRVQGRDPDQAAILGVVLRDLADTAFTVGPTVFFSFSAIILAILFYQTRLVPRWLSLWKLIGGVLLLAQGFLILFDATTPMLDATLFLPIAVNEMVLAVWLIVKGFSPSALRDLAGKSTV